MGRAGHKNLQKNSGQLPVVSCQCDNGQRSTAASGRAKYTHDKRVARHSRVVNLRKYPERANFRNQSFFTVEAQRNSEIAKRRDPHICPKDGKYGPRDMRATCPRRSLGRRPRWSVMRRAVSSGFWESRVSPKEGRTRGSRRFSNPQEKPRPTA